MSDKCKYLDFCLGSIVSVCYASPETCDIYKRESKDKPILRQVAEIIKRCKEYGDNDAADIQAATEVVRMVGEIGEEYIKELKAIDTEIKSSFSLGRVNGVKELLRRLV